MSVRCRGLLLTTVAAGLAAFLFSTLSAVASDWPQWRGIERTAISKETGLLKSWPKEGPKLAWKTKGLGGGFTTPSVAAGRIYGMGVRGGDEVVWALDESTGKEVWQCRLGAFNKSIGHNEGPRGTPTIDGHKLYTIGVSGDLVCLDADSGKEIWRRNFVKEFGGTIPHWGYSESPLIEGNSVIATPGGKEATIAAFDKNTGKTIWTSKDPEDTVKEEGTASAKKEEPAQGRRRRRPAPPGQEPAGYSSPIAFTVGGIRQVATFTSKGGIGVQAKDGKFLWRNNKAANGTANIATPIYHDGRIFFTSDYGTGCVSLELKPDGTAKEVYFNKDMKNHHGGVVLLDGYLYGFNSGILTCMKFADGSVAWKDRSVGKGSVCYADGLLFVFSERGVLGLVEATPKAYKEIARFNTPDRSNAPSWSHPVIANGKLYIRDQETLLCYDVKQP